MGRSSIMVRLARCVQASPLWLFRFLEWPFVTLLARRSAKKHTQAIFVLALPRSGSTVTYQILCHGLSVQYLSNLWNLCYQLPLLGGWLSSFSVRQHHSDFQSQRGFVPGLDGPAEGLRFWRWWLDCGLSDQSCETLTVNKRYRRSSYLLKVLSVLTRHKKSRPFATAYLGHALVPNRVHRTFPGAALIRLRRDPVSNALSLLRSMRSHRCTWFSVVPRECYEYQTATAHERVAAQVYWLNRRLDKAACFTEFLTVHYETLCESPDKELERIRKWCYVKGITMEPKFPLPKQFSYKIADLEGDPDAIKIKQALNRLEEVHGKLEGTQA